MKQQWMSFNSVMDAIQRSLQESNQGMAASPKGSTPFAITEFSLDLAVLTQLKPDPNGSMELWVKFLDPEESSATSTSEQQFSRVSMTIKPILSITST